MQQICSRRQATRIMSTKTFIHHLRNGTVIIDGEKMQLVIAESDREQDTSYDNQEKGDKTRMKLISKESKM